MRLRDHPGFRLFRTASTVSDFGTQVTRLATQVLIATRLAGTAAHVGLINAARRLPYLLVGIVVLWVSAAGVALAAAALLASPFRAARVPG